MEGTRSMKRWLNRMNNKRTLNWNPKTVRSIQSARVPKIRNRPVTLAKTWEPKK
jgi:hypothetical protein